MPTTPVRDTQEHIQEAPTTKLVLDKSFAGAFKAGDATPSVLNLEYFATAGVEVNITYFNHGQDSQRIHVLGDGKSTIINDAAKIRTNTGSNKLLHAGQMYVFTLMSGVWYEDAAAPATPSALGLVIGVDVQAYNVLLQALSLLLNSQGLLYNDGTGVLAWVRSVSAEVPTGAIDGVNIFFTTSAAFMSGTLVVYLNGLRQKLADDYTETSAVEFRMVMAPLAGDVIVVDYLTTH